MSWFERLFGLRRPLGLQGKLMLSFLILVVVIGGVGAFCLTEHEREVRLDALEGKATRVANFLSLALDPPLWNVDKAAIDALLASLAVNPEVAEFTITATNAGIISSVKPLASTDPNDQIVRVEEIFHSASPAAPREKLGEIKVVMSKAAATKEIRHAQIILLVSMLCLLIGLYVAVYHLLRLMVHRPIKQLTTTIDLISCGDLDAWCPITSDDELGGLAVRVNAMARNLRKSTRLVRESEQKYRRIFENAIEGMFLLERSGRLREVNPAMVGMLGYSSAEELLSGDPGQGRRSVFSVEQVQHLFVIAVSNDGIVGLEMELRKHDGAPVWVELNARIVAATDGEPAYLEGMLADITIRRFARERLRAHRDRLQREVSERRRAEAELVASQEQLRRISAHMEGVREEERKHIAMTVHDELGQLLTALKIDASLLKNALDHDSPGVHRIDQMSGLVDKTLQIVRDVASHLRPAALNYGLESALEWLAGEFTRHGSVRCDFVLSTNAPELPDAQATAIFRIAQEALTNVARHAGATQVELRLGGNGHRIELTITDDGIGFDPTVRPCKSYGLLGMKERARMLGGELTIDSARGEGARVRLTLQADAVKAHRVYM